MRILICIIAVIIAIIAGCVWVIVDYEQTNFGVETYHAWKQLYPQSQLTYVEWKRLNKADLLPGQHKTETVVVPQPIFIHQ